MPHHRAPLPTSTREQVGRASCRRGSGDVRPGGRLAGSVSTSTYLQSALQHLARGRPGRAGLVDVGWADVNRRPRRSPTRYQPRPRRSGAPAVSRTSSSAATSWPIEAEVAAAAFDGAPGPAAGRRLARRAAPERPAVVAALPLGRAPGRLLHGRRDVEQLQRPPATSSAPATRRVVRARRWEFVRWIVDDRERLPPAPRSTTTRRSRR